MINPSLHFLLSVIMPAQWVPNLHYFPLKLLHLCQRIRRTWRSWTRTPLETSKMPSQRCASVWIVSAVFQLYPKWVNSCCNTLLTSLGFVWCRNKVASLLLNLRPHRPAWTWNLLLNLLLNRLLRLQMRLVKRKRTSKILNLTSPNPHLSWQVGQD